MRPYTRVWNDAKGSSRPTRELAAAIVEKAPFFVVPEKERLEAKAGDKLELKVQIKRLWPEFTGDLKLLPLSWPGNFQMPELPVAAGANGSNRLDHDSKRHRAERIHARPARPGPGAIQQGPRRERPPEHARLAP